eukprot:1160669-Pelagomonas_calceolata.AAC.3
MLRYRKIPKPHISLPATSKNLSRRIQTTLPNSTVCHLKRLSRELEHVGCLPSSQPAQSHLQLTSAGQNLHLYLDFCAHVPEFTGWTNALVYIVMHRHVWLAAMGCMLAIADKYGPWDAGRATFYSDDPHMSLHDGRVGNLAVQGKLPGTMQSSLNSMAAQSSNNNANGFTTCGSCMFGYLGNRLGKSKESWMVREKIVTLILFQQANAARLASLSTRPSTACFFRQSELNLT